MELWYYITSTEAPITAHTRARRRTNKAAPIPRRFTSKWKVKFLLCLFFNRFLISVIAVVILWICWNWNNSVTFVNDISFVARVDARSVRILARRNLIPDDRPCNRETTSVERNDATSSLYGEKSLVEACIARYLWFKLWETWDVPFRFSKRRSNVIIILLFFFFSFFLHFSFEIRCW